MSALDELELERPNVLAADDPHIQAAFTRARAGLVAVLPSEALDDAALHIDRAREALLRQVGAEKGEARGRMLRAILDLAGAAKNVSFARLAHLEADEGGTTLREVQPPP